VELNGRWVSGRAVGAAIDELGHVTAGSSWYLGGGVAVRAARVSLGNQLRQSQLSHVD